LLKSSEVKKSRKIKLLLELLLLFLLPQCGILALGESNQNIAKNTSKNVETNGNYDVKEVIII
jgi:hypothetical protein